MPKSSKRFIISTDAVNANGFRMLTKGAVLDAFLANPVLLFNHIRPTGNNRNQILPLGYWTDLEVTDNEITAVPFFDDKDPFAMLIYEKVEAGILKMCSAGAEPLETSDDPSLLIKGQTAETVTKWKLKEASICDIGANPESLTVALYDNLDRLIQLTEKNKNYETIIPILKNTKKMNKLRFKRKIRLSDKTNEELNDELENEELNDDQQELTDDQEELTDDETLTDDDKDAIIEKLKEELKLAQQELKLAQEQLKLADDKANEEKVENLVNKAISLRKITLAQKSDYIKLAKQDYKTTFRLLQNTKSAISIKNAIENTASSVDQTRLVKLSEKSWDELFNTTEAIDYLKLNAPDVYAKKFEAKFGKKPKNI